MAERASVMPAFQTSTTAALASAESLDAFLNGVQSRKLVIRELREEVKALCAVLQYLYGAVEMPNADLPNVEIPKNEINLLRQCGIVCQGFERVVKDTIPDTCQPMIFNDWGQVNYLGGDVTQFKDMLAGYRSTLVIICLYAVW